MGTAQTSPEQCTIPVTGMTCAACSARIQRTLERREGVSAANVNLMTGAATVTYDPAATTPEDLVAAIRATGYGAELPRPGESAESLVALQDTARGAEIAELKGKLAVSLAAGGLAAIVSAPLMVATEHARDPLSAFMAPLTAVLSTGLNLLLEATGTHVDFAGVRGSLGLFAVSLAYGIFVSAVGGAIGTGLAHRHARLARPTPITAAPTAPPPAAEPTATVESRPVAPPSHI